MRHSNLAKKSNLILPLVLIVFIAVVAGGMIAFTSKSQGITGAAVTCTDTDYDSDTIDGTQDGKNFAVRGTIILNGETKSSDYCVDSNGYQVTETPVGQGYLAEYFCYQGSTMSVWGEQVTSNKQCKNGAIVDSAYSGAQDCQFLVKQCSQDNKGYQECKDYNGDGKLEWSDAIPCQEGYTCQAGECKCTDDPDCSINSNWYKRCTADNKGYQTCKQNAEGCWKWENTESCTYGCLPIRNILAACSICFPSSSWCTSNVLNICGVNGLEKSSTDCTKDSNGKATGKVCAGALSPALNARAECKCKTDECLTGQTGCVSSAQKWSCGDTNADSCLERIPEPCTTGTTCQTITDPTTKVISGACMTPDADGDQMPDSWEAQYPGVHKYQNATDATLDLDTDGLTNLQEYQKGTKPNVADTDSDGSNDGAEVTAGTDPLDPTSKPSAGGTTSDDDTQTDNTQPSTGTPSTSQPYEPEPLPSHTSTKTTKTTPPAPMDSDKDGIPDSEDNCKYAANPDQKDSNNNGVGSACDEEASSSFMWIVVIAGVIGGVVALAFFLFKKPNLFAQPTNPSLPSSPQEPPSPLPEQSEVASPESQESDEDILQKYNLEKEAPN